MAANLMAERQTCTVFDAHALRLAAAGSARHPFAVEISAETTPTTARDLDDFVHLLANLYGRYPGLLDIAVNHCPSGPTRDWLGLAATAFDRERHYLLRLSAAVGPMPSTPGNPQTEAALLAQRHAMEILAQSERCGCALGAATALVGDWAAFRPIFDRAAQRAGVEIPSCLLPGEESIAEILETAAAGVAGERAIRFGAEQLLLQHRALFDLLEARCEAREDY